MDELVKMVTQETGLPEAQARKAAEAVIKFLKTKPNCRNHWLVRLIISWTTTAQPMQPRTCSRKD